MALLELYDDGIPEEVFDERFEDVHAGIESLLVESLGVEAGGRMHMGRSRNDEVATCIRIKVREELLKQMSALLKVRKRPYRSFRKAHQHGHAGVHPYAACTAYHACPPPPFLRAGILPRFRPSPETYVRVNQSPLGAAAFASTGYPISREFTADLLGFDGIVTNTMDAVATRDFAFETLAGLSILMANTSRLCEELVIWSSSFVKFVSLDDAFCSTSSIMPQKKNPDSAEIMRAKTGSVFGAYTAALMIVKGLPMSYNRDLQELTPHIWRGLRDSKESTRLLIDMLASAEFDTARMKEEAGKGFSTATELADTLVRSYGIPFRTAHSIVGKGSTERGPLARNPGRCCPRGGTGHLPFLTRSHPAEDKRRP